MQAVRAIAIKVAISIFMIVLLSACTELDILTGGTEGKLAPSDTSNGDLVLLEWQFVEGEHWPEVKGVVANNTDKKFSMVVIKFALYDNQGYRVGEASDYIDSMGAGQKWKFAAMVIDEAATRVEPVDLKGIPDY